MSTNLQTAVAFGRYNIGISNFYAPADIAGVNQVYQTALNSGGTQRIAIRGGGHSFDGQAVHTGDTGNQIILSNQNFQSTKNDIHWNTEGADTVTLGSGVSWRTFVEASIQQSQQGGGPILLPGSMETGGAATVAGTLSGGCLSRFSGVLGKESQWINSFRILTPSNPNPIYCSRTQNPDLFWAAIGGFGYLGFVTEATYRLMEVPAGSCAHTHVTTYPTLSALIQAQLDMVNGPQNPPHAISSAWFTGPTSNASHAHTALAASIAAADPSIKGGIFDSVYAQPTGRPHFPLYHDLFSDTRFASEVAARVPLTNYLVHLGLYELCKFVTKFDDDIDEFLFFMDGDTYARQKYLQVFGVEFPIIEQTYVLPVDKTESFTANSMEKIADAGFDASDCDMLYVKADTALMSANYNLDGFAVSWCFEPTNPETPPPDLLALLRELSVDCQQAGGRIHLPKNAHVDRDTFRRMFCPQITTFEAIKRQYDPNLLIQNPYSDQFFAFAAAAACA
jgi:decaprenylphospho-beta-D-ribofuranose 2-oxidase